MTDTPHILVTGGAGYIGSQTAWALIEAGFAVTVVDDLSAGLRERVPSPADFVQMDCGSPRMLELLRERAVEAVVHFAARIRLDESLRDPLGYYHANLCTAHALFAAAAAAGTPALVFSSTAAVYGDAGRAPVAETQMPVPETPYGRSKLAAEWILQDLSRATPLRHISLRYFNVAGADPLGRTGPRADATHLVKIVAEAAAGRRRSLVINGDDWPTPDGTCIRDYIHVADLAAVHVAAVRHLLKGGESLTLNCGYGSGYSVREVVAAGLRLARQPFEVVTGPRRPGDMPLVVADAARLGLVLDWVPAHNSLDAMVASAIDWEARSR